jgi:hypothetical protein
MFFVFCLMIKRKTVPVSARNSELNPRWPSFSVSRIPRLGKGFTSSIRALIWLSEKMYDRMLPLL